MKRTISLILVLVLCLGLCACGENKDDYVGVWHLRENTFIYIYEDGTGDIYSAKYDAFGNLKGEHYNAFTWELEDDYFVKTSPDGLGSTQVSKFKLSGDELLDKQGKVYATKYSKDTSVDVDNPNRK